MVNQTIIHNCISLSKDYLHIPIYCNNMVCMKHVPTMLPCDHIWVKFIFP